MKMFSFTLKANVILVIAVFLLLAVGCQTENGELLPVITEPAVAATSRFENDTALVNDGKIKIKFYGTWTASGYIHLRVGLSNDSEQPLKLKFKEIVLKNDKNRNWTISTINEKPSLTVIYSNSGHEELPVIEIKGHENKSFLLEFAPIINFADAETADKTLNVIVPVDFNGTTKSYQAVFNVVSQKDDSGKSDPNDW